MLANSAIVVDVLCRVLGGVVVQQRTPSQTAVSRAGRQVNLNSVKVPSWILLRLDGGICWSHMGASCTAGIADSRVGWPTVAIFVGVVC